MPAEPLLDPWTARPDGSWSAFVSGHIWTLRPDSVTPDKYRVYRDEILASKAIRSLALSARWAAARFSRVGRSLRGPVPRRQSTADQRLPDFRVSAEEREILLRRSAALDMPYAAYGRGALLALEPLLDSGKLQVAVENGEVQFTVP